MTPLNKFGIEIKRPNEDAIRNSYVTFTPPDPMDGSTVVLPYNAHYGHYMDISGVSSASFKDLVNKYRTISEIPECDQAIEEILSEAIVHDETGPVVEIFLDDIPFSENIKKKIQEEFEYILSKLDFNTNGHDIFRKWYVDSLLVYHKIIDPNSSKKGIIDIVPIDPTLIKKVKEIEELYDKKSSTILFKIKDEYFVYGDKNLRISPDIITYVPSGLYDYTNKRITGYLYKALKTANQLSMMEDSMVVYRYTRSPERRVFYIDVGNLPKGKAEEYVRNIMNKYRNKITYNVQTGVIEDEKRHMAMLEDFWLPRREGGKGTEISTLPGATSLGIEDVDYFRRKLYRSLNVPLNRLEQEGTFSLGRSSEVTREEVKFSRFINRIRAKFSELFYDLLKTQLELKNIIRTDEWDSLKENIRFDYQEDNHFAEMKSAEILSERFQQLNLVDQYVGKYISREFVRKFVLMQSDEDIKRIDKEMKDDIKNFGQEFDSSSSGGSGNGGYNFDIPQKQPPPTPPAPQPLAKKDSEEEGVI